MSMYEDLAKIIQRHQPISTAECCEHLEKLGYGGSLSWDDYRSKISKALHYMSKQGKIAGSDVARKNNKPLRMWSLTDVQTADEQENPLETARPQATSTVSEAIPEPHQNIQPTEKPVPGPEYARTIPTETIVAPNRKTVRHEEISGTGKSRVTVEELLEEFNRYDHPPAGVPLLEVFAAAVVWMESRT